MSQPEGFVKQREADKVCLLRKSLYGLKQSPRQWYRRFDDFMLKGGFLMSSFDNCVYYSELSNHSYIYLLIYVDDMLLACNDIKEIKR